MSAKERFKIIYIRPPYSYWPIINRADNYLAPLNLPTLAGYIREKMPDVEQKIIDCMPLKIGFKSLYNILVEEQPDMVGIGDMICYHEEGMRACALAKQANPNCVTVAGGPFFSHVAPWALDKFPQLDYIIKYEGEETLRELIEFVRNGKSMHSVRGLAFRNEGTVIETPPRPLITDLDSLPMPAYDMLPMSRYSTTGMVYRKAITVQAERGCPFACDYCTWTYTEGERRQQPDGTIRFNPKIRTKSPDRMMEEIAWLYEKFGASYLFWVDATWNYDSEWLDKFCSEIIRRKYKLGWWAFTRADLMLKQQEQGVLQTMVDAGLRHCLFGAERGDPKDLHDMGKDRPLNKKITPNHFVECCKMLEKHHPRVFRQACFLVGLPDDKAEDLEKLSKFARESHLDFAAIHAFMPYPGTPTFERYKHLIEEWDYTKWDMFFPVMRTNYLTREEIAQHTRKMNLDFVMKNPFRYLRRMFSPYELRRRLHWWFAFSFARVFFRDLFLGVLRRKKFQGYAGVQRLWKPKWYED